MIYSNFYNLVGLSPGLVLMLSFAAAVGIFILVFKKVYSVRVSHVIPIALIESMLVLAITLGNLYFVFNLVFSSLVMP